MQIYNFDRNDKSEYLRLKHCIFYPEKVYFFCRLENILEKHVFVCAYMCIHCLQIHNDKDLYYNIGSQGVY